jgi:hypothetical protein
MGTLTPPTPTSLPSGVVPEGLGGGGVRANQSGYRPVSGRGLRSGPVHRRTARKNSGIAHPRRPTWAARQSKVGNRRGPDQRGASTLEAGEVRHGGGHRIRLRRRHGSRNEVKRCFTYLQKRAWVGSGHSFSSVPFRKSGLTNRLVSGLLVKRIFLASHSSLPGTCSEMATSASHSA